MKVGIRKQVSCEVKTERQIQSQEESAPGKANPCSDGGDPVAEA
jgi:hypothetical protein